jgi:pimeloyl-ACP methyl ester carboxylesterase
VRYTLHLPVRPPYRLADMAADTLGVMDALGLQSAHVCGASMGGMIAQHLAARQPERVRSLLLMMTTSGARRLPQPSMKVRGALLSRPDGARTRGVVAHLQHLCWASAARPPAVARSLRGSACAFASVAAPGGPRAPRAS